MNSVTLETVNAKLDKALLLLSTMGATPREVLPVHEALAFVGKPSVQSFAAWCKKHQVRPVSHGRYSLRSLRAAMEREARKSYTHGGA